LLRFDGAAIDVMSRWHNFPVYYLFVYPEEGCSPETYSAETLVY
jgi:hypothetical protein